MHPPQDLRLGLQPWVAPTKCVIMAKEGLLWGELACASCAGYVRDAVHCGQKAGGEHQGQATLGGLLCHPGQVEQEQGAAPPSAHATACCNSAISSQIPSVASLVCSRVKACIISRKCRSCRAQAVYDTSGPRFLCHCRRCLGRHRVLPDMLWLCRSHRLLLRHCPWGRVDAQCA